MQIRKKEILFFPSSRLGAFLKKIFLPPLCFTLFSHRVSGSLQRIRPPFSASFGGSSRDGAPG
jgi:hypothetical protein